jgi:hypothetical protein
VGGVTAAGERAALPGEPVSRAVRTALFARAADERATAALGRADLSGDLLPAVVRQLRALATAVGASGPVEVTGDGGEPGLVLVTAGSGRSARHVGVQVAGHGDLLDRGRVEQLPARRDRFRAAYGPDADWHLLLAGDLGDHRVRQRVQSVQGRFAWDGDLVVAPQYAAGFLRLGPADLDRLAAGAALPPPAALGRWRTA